MEPIAERLAKVHAEIRDAEDRHGRSPGSVGLLAVSKTQPVAALRAAAAAGQAEFGENYVDEGAAKIRELADEALNWHFVGPVQSNKTRTIAETFDFVHTIDRLKIARRLSAQRPEHLPPLECCIQVNVSGETSKSGVAPEAVADLAQAMTALPRIRLRGLMAIPAPADDFTAQRRPHARLRQLLAELQGAGLALDTLSMGMSADLEAAIAEGATLVRVGTAIFGPRQT